MWFWQRELFRLDHLRQSTTSRHPSVGNDPRKLKRLHNDQWTDQNRQEQLRFISGLQNFWNKIKNTGQTAIEPTRDIGENLAHNLSTTGFEHFQIRFPPFYLGFHNLQSSFCWMKNVNFLSAFPSFLLHLSICVLRSWSTEIKQRLNPLFHAFYWSFLVRLSQH